MCDDNNLNYHKYFLNKLPGTDTAVMVLEIKLSLKLRTGGQKDKRSTKGQCRPIIPRSYFMKLKLDYTECKYSRTYNDTCI